MIQVRAFDQAPDSLDETASRWGLGLASLALVSSDSALATTLGSPTPSAGRKQGEGLEIGHGHLPSDLMPLLLLSKESYEVGWEQVVDEVAAEVGMQMVRNEPHF